jgi:hypothetical protein
MNVGMQKLEDSKVWLCLYNSREAGLGYRGWTRNFFSDSPRVVVLNLSRGRRIFELVSPIRYQDIDRVLTRIEKEGFEEREFVPLWFEKGCLDDDELEGCHGRLTLEA